jgi:hypothetical protein
MNIEESNKLIAEFMGYEVSNYCIYTEKGNVGYLLSVKVNNGRTFDTSWDWLIPVIRKCRTKYLKGAEKKFFTIEDSLVMLDIDLVYKTVVEFIKWYNKEEKNQR